jgi:hypothetical protein
MVKNAVRNRKWGGCLPPQQSDHASLPTGSKCWLCCEDHVLILEYKMYNNVSVSTTSYPLRCYAYKLSQQSKEKEPDAHHLSLWETINQLISHHKQECCDGMPWVPRA